MKESKQAEKNKKEKLIKQGCTKKRNSETDDYRNKQRKEGKETVIKKRKTNLKTSNGNHNKKKHQNRPRVRYAMIVMMVKICVCFALNNKTSIDSWIQCTSYLKWAHDDCAGVDEDDEEFECDL